MYKDVCQQLAPFASASFHVCPCLLTMMLLLMMVMDGQQAEQQTQHTSTQIDPSFSVSNSRSLSLSLFLSCSHFLANSAKATKYCGLIEAFFQLDHSLSFPNVCSSSVRLHTHTHTGAQRKLYQLFRL